MAGSITHHDPAPGLESGAGDLSKTAWERGHDFSGLIESSVAAAKGDILVATGAGVVSVRSVGTDGKLLTADSGQATGLNYVARDQLNVLTAKGTFISLGTPVGANSTLTANSAYVGRLVLPFTFTPNRIGCAIHVSSGNLDMGIYSDDGTGLGPGTRIASLGSTASPGTGAREFAISPGQLVPGVYWLAFAANNGTISVSYVGPGTGSSNGGGGVLPQQKATSFALPNPLSGMSASTFVPAMWLSIL